MTSNIQKVTDLETSGRELSAKEREFCKWFTGTMRGEDGSATEENVLLSALAAGYSEAEAAKMGNKMRNSLPMLAYIATLNKERRPETMATIEAYARRALGVLNGLLDSDNDKIRLGAAKELVALSAVKNKDAEEKTNNTLIQMQVVFAQQMEKMAQKLGEFTPSYDKVRKSRGVKPVELGIPDQDEDGDEPIVD